MDCFHLIQEVPGVYDTDGVLCLKKLIDFVGSSLEWESLTIVHFLIL